MQGDFEKIAFTIWNNKGMCRIEANDCRSEIRALSNGACISDMEVLNYELNRINVELAKRRAYPVYTVCSWDDYK